MSATRQTLLLMFTGVGLGFVVSAAGFTNWDAIHRMFTFAEFRLLLTFGSAAVILAVGWTFLSRFNMPNWSPRHFHRGSLPGGLLVGFGWAISGACPTIVMVQLGEGQLGALWTIGGILIGNYVYSVVHPKFFGWSISGCGDD